MPRKKKQDPDVKVMDDDVDDDEAMLNAEDDTDDTDEPDDKPEETPAFWKQKYYDAERSKSEVASEYRQKINGLQEDLRKARTERDTEDALMEDEASRPTTVSKPAGADGGPPYRLMKWVQEKTPRGEVIMVPREIPGLSFEEPPRAEEVPLPVLLNWGPGEYKIKDARGKVINGFNITGAGAEGAPGMTMGAPPGISPNATIGQYMKDPVQRALDLFDEAKKRGDPKLMERAGQLMDKAIEGSSGGNDFDRTLLLLKQMNEYSQQARALVMPPGGAPGYGGPEDKEVALKRLEMEANDKKWSGVERIIAGVADKAQGLIEVAAEKFKGPQADPSKVAEKARQMASGQAQFVPATQTPPPRPSPPPTPPQPAPPKASAPPGTVVECGGCHQKMPIPDFLTHVTSCPGGGQPAAQQGTPQQAAAPPSQQTGGHPMPSQLPEDLKTYLGLMKSITNYIIAYEEGDKDASPEAVAGTVWLGLKVPGKEADRDKLLSIVDMGYDQIVNRQDLNDIVVGLGQFPNFTPEQTALIIEASVISGIMKPEEVDLLDDIGDLGPAVDEFKNQISIQKSPKGREWICRLLNAVAIKAGRPAPHGDFLPGGGGQKRGGADNL